MRISHSLRTICIVYGWDQFSCSHSGIQQESVFLQLISHVLVDWDDSDRSSRLDPQETKNSC